MLPISLNTIRFLLSTTQAPHISRINPTHCNPHVHSSQFHKSIIYPTIDAHTHNTLSLNTIRLITIHHSCSPISLNTIRYLLSTTQAHHISRINQTHCNPHVHSSQFLKSIIHPTIDPHTPNTLPLNTIRYLLSTTQVPDISRIKQTHCNPHVHS